jgi:hypothetical protein
LIHRVAIIALAAAASAWGQPLPRPDPQPVQPTGVRPDADQDASIPGLEDADFMVGASALRSEGSFLVERRGTMLKLPTGERVMVFFPDAKGKRERPMVLVPCQHLQQMEQVAGDDGVAFVVTGEVFVYRAINYFMPTLVRQAGAETETNPAPKSRLHAVEGDPAVKDLIRQLEEQREQPRGSAGAALPRPETAEGALLPEGRAISRRRGRLVRQLDGEWALAFDAGPAGSSAVDKPMALSPCLNLQRMEAWAMRAGDATAFEVSGRVLAYQGKNTLIPTMFQVLPKSDLEPAH